MVKSILQKVRAEHILLAAILVISFALRTYRLGSFPPALFADEASIGYNAYTIATAGTDEHGVSFPLFFRAFGEYKSPVQIYATAPFVGILGLTETAVRLPSAFLGTISVYVAYLLGKTIFRRLNPKASILTASSVGLIVSCLTAISPWHIHFSRIGFEMIPYILFTSLGVYFLFSNRSMLAIVTFGISLYTYFAARITVPVFLIFSLVFIYAQTKSFTRTVPYLLITILFLLPITIHMTTGAGLSRYHQASVLEDTRKTVWEKAEHVGRVYALHYSPDYLFRKGESGMTFLTRHSLRDVGLLYPFQAPALVAGLAWIVYAAKSRKKTFWAVVLLFVWVLVYPLASSITRDDAPAATRSISGVLLFQVVSGIGIWVGFVTIAKIVKKMFTKKKASIAAQYSYIILITAIAFSSLVPYLYHYYFVYASYSTNFWGWQYGAKEIISYFQEHKTEYDDLYMQPEFNAPDIFFQFYDHDATCVNCHVGWYVEQYDPSRRQLFAVTPDRVGLVPQADPRVVDTIKYPNGDTAFFLIETIPDPAQKI